MIEILKMLGQQSGIHIFLIIISILGVLYVSFRVVSMAIFNSWSQMFYKCTECAFYKKVKEIENVEKKEENQKK